uniref:(northern house mosquito) hypothetical protein n=1 Tax=Culex pipiens TaxID=7175 RepID=A0A8D8CJL4_CULPI
MALWVRVWCLAWVRVLFSGRRRFFVLEGFLRGGPPPPTTFPTHNALCCHRRRPLGGVSRGWAWVSSSFSSSLSFVRSVWDNHLFRGRGRGCGCVCAPAVVAKLHFKLVSNRYRTRLIFL